MWGDTLGYLALYRKYRPDSFDKVVGQDKVIKVISNAILNNRVSHAYLFSGPRGTGKTTTAKIIAKMVNCENLIDGKPCEKCFSCLNFLNSNDIVEIDAASNNGVEEIREIRDKVNFVPTSCKYKVYIIDEVHMLTTQAFNALLKTLEEPPSHVIFILATTEFHKIPLTISSRCQKFQFTKIDAEDIVKRLKEICNLENIKITDEALYEIARLADGGLRDAINLLDQLSAYKSEEISIDDVFKINGAVSYDELYNILISVINKNNDSIISYVENIDKNGKNINKFIEELIIFLKDVLIYKNSKRLTNILTKNEKIIEISKLLNDDVIFDYISQLNNLLSQIKVASYPSILLIVCLLKLSSLSNNNDDVSKIITEKKEPEKVVVDKPNDLKVINTLNNIDIDVRVNNALATAKKDALIKIKEKWNKLSDYLLDDRYSVVAGLLVDVIPVVASDNYIILECKYDATAFRLNELDCELSNLFFDLYKIKFSVVAISVDRWNKERSIYVEKLKNGEKYSLKEEKIVKKESKTNGDVDKIISLLGEDVIEYR